MRKQRINFKFGQYLNPSDLSSISAYLAFEPSEEKQEKVCGYEEERPEDEATQNQLKVKLYFHGIHSSDLLLGAELIWSQVLPSVKRD